MSLVEEVIEATLNTNGQLLLSHPPRIPPGPVQVIIRAGAATGPRRSLADVIREIAAEQRARGFLGRSAEELIDEDIQRQADDTERDNELDASRGGSSPGGS